MTPEPDLPSVLRRLAAVEAVLAAQRDRAKRRARLLASAGKLCLALYRALWGTGTGPVLAVLGLATWALGQGVEIKTSDGAADQTRLKVDSGAATVSTYFLNTMVGIGTNGPTRPLTVQGSGAQHEWISLKDTAGVTQWHLNRYNSLGLNFAETGVADGRLYLADGGYVGMGTTTPVSNLHLYQAANIAMGLDLDTPGTGASQQTAINLHTTGDGTKALGVAGTTGWHLVARGNAYPSGNNDLGLYYWNGASWLDRMRWQNASGNVGISTSSPQSPLHIYNGTAGNRPTLLLESSSANCTPRLGFVDTSLGAVTAAPAWFIDNNSDTFRIYRQSNITTAGALHFSIDNAGSARIYEGQNLYFQAPVGSPSDPGDVVFQTNAAAQKGRIWTEPGANNYLHFSCTDNTPDFDVYDGGSTQVFGTTAGCVSGPGSSGPDNWLRLTTTVNGATYHDLAVDNFWAAGSTRFDLAEVTPVDPADLLTPGELVAADPSTGVRMRKTRGAYEPAVLGIVTQPVTSSMTIGGGVDPAEIGDRAELRTIALAGRVATIVNLENGPVRIGDPIASSSAPGAGMRAVRRGSIVGRALETFDGTTVNSPGVQAIVEQLKRDLIPPTPEPADHPRRPGEPPEYARYRRAIAQLTAPLPPGTGRIIVFVSPGSYVPEDGDLTVGGAFRPRLEPGMEECGLPGGDDAARDELLALRKTVETLKVEIGTLRAKAARLDALEARLAALEKPAPLATVPGALR